jgi:heme oxygenase (biliverdin-producing, ferredoxin)
LSDNLKELTKQHHRNAERSRFVSRMLRKELTQKQYYTYLVNQFMAYSALETYGKDIFEGELKRIIRAHRILDDISKLQLILGPQRDSSWRVLPSTQRYVEHLRMIKDDSDAILAHVYVRHMGDLSGGQIIKRFVPGPASHLEFDGEPEELKALLREKLHDGLAEEANVCFRLIADVMEDLENSFVA